MDQIFPLVLIVAVAGAALFGLLSGAVWCLRRLALLLPSLDRWCCSHGIHAWRKFQLYEQIGLGKWTLYMLSHDGVAIRRCGHHVGGCGRLEPPGSERTYEEYKNGMILVERGPWGSFGKPKISRKPPGR